MIFQHLSKIHSWPQFIKSRLASCKSWEKPHWYVNLENFRKWVVPIVSVRYHGLHWCWRWFEGRNTCMWVTNLRCWWQIFPSGHQYLQSVTNSAVGDMKSFFESHFLCWKQVKYTNLVQQPNEFHYHYLSFHKYHSSLISNKLHSQ